MYFTGMFGAFALLRLVVHCPFSVLELDYAGVADKLPEKIKHLLLEELSCNHARSFMKIYKKLSKVSNLFLNVAVIP